ncbi:MAG: aspartate kinase [Spirochaetales bacterium]|nr:aspartate kinase [Spirochaetales bacterium]
MKVYKLAGNYITDIELLKSVPEMIKGKNLVIVTSADSDLEKEMLIAARLAEGGNSQYMDSFSNIYETVNKINISFTQAISQGITRTLSDIRDILEGVYLVKYLSPSSEAVLRQLSSFITAEILKAYLNTVGEEYQIADPTNLFVSGKKTIGSTIDLDKTTPKFKDVKAKTIIPGGIAADEEGRPTIPGQYSFDYTAVVAATALEAEEIVIWTDKEGIYTADPDIVEEAYLIEKLSPQEAMELSYFGAKIIHPFAFNQAFAHGIPIFITHSQLEEGKGTYISEKNEPPSQIISGIASIKDCAIVTICGSELTGKRGFAAEVFTQLAASGVNILMISQASSENSICLVCTKEEAFKAQKTLSRHLQQSIKANTIQEISLIQGVEIISVVGQGMKDRPGTAGKIFSLLGDEKISILAIAQGSSEYSISFAIKQEHSAVALKKIHKDFLG